MWHECGYLFTGNNITTGTVTTTSGLCIKYCPIIVSKIGATIRPKIILKEENLTIDLDKETVYTRLIETENANTIRELNHFNQQVPHWQYVSIHDSRYKTKPQKPQLIVLR